MMSRKSQKETKTEDLRSARLEIIRQRHKKLILEPRQSLMAVLDDDMDYPLEDYGEPDELELVEVSGFGEF